MSPITTFVILTFLFFFFFIFTRDSFLSKYLRLVIVNLKHTVEKRAVKCQYLDWLPLVLSLLLFLFFFSYTFSYPFSSSSWLNRWQSEKLNGEVKQVWGKLKSQRNETTHIDTYKQREQMTYLFIIKSR